MVHQKPGTFPSFRVNKGTLTDWYFNSQFLVWFSLTPSCFFSFLPAESRCVSICHLLVINQHPNKQGLWWLQRKKRKEIESERERRRKKKVSFWRACSIVRIPNSLWHLVPVSTMTRFLPAWATVHKSNATQKIEEKNRHARLRQYHLRVCGSPEPPVKIHLINSH